MSAGPTVTVFGAGALGLTAALALADTGCEVTVVDPAPLGDNASGVAAGMLAPAFESAVDGTATPHFGLLMAARDLWPALAVRTGIELDRRGAVARGSADWLAAVTAKLSALGVGPEILHDGLLISEDWRVDAGLALVALRNSAEAAGVVFRANEGEAGDWRVAATGPAWGLAPELSVLTPIKGHILFAPLPLHRVVRGERAYAVPAAGGMLVGASMEPGMGDRAIDPVQVARLKAAGAELFDVLAETEVAARAAVRAATPDGLPLAGFSARPRTLVAAGARRNGWLLAPLVAQVIAACVTGGDPGPYAARLDPRRFGEG